MDIDKIKDLYIKEYINYLYNPIENANKMTKLIFMFSHISSLWTEDLFHENIKHKFHKITKNLFPFDTLKTNGSTGIERNIYNWGPNFKLFANSIWDFIHRKHYNFTNRYSIKFGTKNIIHEKSKNNEGIILEIFPEKEINLQLHKSAFILSPSVLYKFIKSNHFIDFIKKYAEVISITDSDSNYYDFSILQELNIPLINQMRSWKEGTAFYTCPYNKMHWMENLFYCTSQNQVYDLYNFHNDWWKFNNPDDIWIINKNFELCECGAQYRELNFQPHAIKWFFNHLGEPSRKYSMISKKTINNTNSFFQIIQKNDLKTFEIYSENELDEIETKKIKTYLKDIFESNSFKLILKKGLYQIGRNNKAPVFWSEYTYSGSKKLFNILT